MRIAQVSPLAESVPPQLYGGTERVVSYLTDEFVRMGHDVTLFASGDSRTSARLVAPVPRALRLDPECRDALAHHMRLLEVVFAMAHTFDVVHFHIDYLHFPLSRCHRIRQVTTLHGRLDIPDLYPLYTEYPDMPVVSISNAQRRPLPHANWQATVYHGLPANLYQPCYRPSGYLAFVGRVSPEKRLDRAIRIARRVRMPLRVAAKVDSVDRQYFERTIEPLLVGPGVEFVGEIGETDKCRFFGEASALLFPVDWPEPFGLVMIEAMACGTPVVAFGCGSVPEIVTPGVNGFIVHDIESAVQSCGRHGSRSPSTPRRSPNSERDSICSSSRSPPWRSRWRSRVSRRSIPRTTTRRSRRCSNPWTPQGGGSARSVHRTRSSTSGFADRLPTST
jgi:glycosyltransferase involved in cell wall biosynthesis